MLYPQSNKRRTTTSLNGIWNFKIVSNDYVPTSVAEDTVLMPVPASMNEITSDSKIRNHVGKVLYETTFSVPKNDQADYRLRIGSLSHKGEIYLNGKKIGEAVNGYYPVDLPLLNMEDENRLSIVIDNRLDFRTFPVGMVEEDGEYKYSATTVGSVGTKAKTMGPRQIINHDFYNFTGIHRDVIVYTVPKKRIEDIVIKTVVGGDYKRIRVDVNGNIDGLRLTVMDGIKKVKETSSLEFEIDNPILWDTNNPHLYTLLVETDTDFYRESFGIRKISYDEKGVYLNDKPVYFKGCGMHEDFLVLGKGNSPAINVKNFELLKWLNANSIRTSHYPYSEEIMNLADRYGILVIDEVPVVGANYWRPYTYGEGRVDEEAKRLHKELIRLLLERDKNHPSVCMISVANETATYEEASRAYYKDVIGYTRTLTDLPITMPEETKFDEKNHCADLVDIICLNRYFGWYDNNGDISSIRPCFNYEVGSYFKEFRKPIIISEFGADTIEGNHSLYGDSFSEEFQENMIKEFCEVMDDCPYIIGEHVWNFADFKTKLGVIRVRGNRKGIFTQDRQPKKVAFYLKDRWSKKDSK